MNATAPTLTRMQLNRATLARQMLLQRAPIAAPDAIDRLAGMQAQEPKHPYVGLWTRVEGFEADELHGALMDRTVVRATLMRATLHMLSGREYRVVRAALSPVMTGALSVIRSRSEGLDIDAVLPAATALLSERPRTFNELRSLLSARFPAANDRALGYVVRTHLPLVMVPARESRWGFERVSEFALAEDWLGEPLSRDESLRPLVRRYLAAFGPASAKDCQVWSGLGALKGVFDAMRDELEVFRDERGRELFDLPDAPRPPPDTVAAPRFLPEFDNLVLAHDDRTRVLEDEHRKVVVTKNLRVRATFLVDGFARGTWTVKRSRGTATLALAPFSALPKRAARALETEGEALLAFLEPDASGYAVSIV